MNLFSKWFNRETPQKCLRRLAEEYDPRGGEADTLQGALADAILCLRDESNRNGWLNGSEFHSECVDLIKKYLCDQRVGAPIADPEQIAADLEAIRDAASGGSFKGRFAYDELERVEMVVGQWCVATPKPIHREEDQDSW